MIRKIIITIIITIILFSGFLVYLNKVLLPLKLKAIIIKNIETITQREAALESLQFNIFKGVGIKGLTIFENPAFDKGPFLKIKEVDFSFLFVPLFKEKKVIITSLKIDSPEFKLIRDKNNLWNFSDLLNIKFEQGKPKQNISFLIYNIRVLKTKCIFEDKNFEPYFSKQLEDFNCRINFSLPSKLKFVFEGNIPGQKQTSLLSAKGEFDLITQKLDAYLIFKDISLTDYSPYYQGLPFILKSGKINNANLKFSWQGDKGNLLAQLGTANLNITKDAYELTGNPNINAKISYSPSLKTKIDYFVEVNPNGLNIEGIAYLKTLQKVNGKIIIIPDKIQFSDIRANSSLALINVSGILDNFANPFINLNIASDVEMLALKEIFKQQLNGLGLDIEGKTHLDLQVSGLLKKASNLQITGKAAFSNLLAKTSLLPEQIKTIGGEIDFDLNHLKWINISGEYLGERYISNGLLKNFISPEVEADLKSRLIQLSAKFEINKGNISLDELEGKFVNSDFNLNGEVDISERENPFCNLKLVLNANLEDLKEALPKLKESFEKIKPSGSIEFAGNFKGKIKDKSSWQIDLKGESPQVLLSGLKLTNLAVDYLQNEASNGNLNISSVFYDGAIEIAGNINSAEGRIPFNLKGKIDNLDLAKLQLDTHFKDKPTSGVFSGVISLKGLTQDLGSWQGRSSFNFKEGNLWELNLFKGLGKFLLIPEFEKIVINEATGEFSIANKNIHVDNIELKSSEMLIDGEGDIDFSGNLNLSLIAQFSEQFIQSSDSLKKFITSILTTASNALTIKVKGTLQSPKYSVKPFVVDIIKNLKGIIFENILKR